MEEEHDKALWDLLGKSETVKDSPLFSRNVLRAVRNEKQRVLVFHWRAWLLPSTACVTILIALATLLPSFTPNIVLHTQADDLEMMRQVDQLIAAESNDGWLEASSY